MLDVKIKKLYDDSIMPTRADEDSAGLDLYSHDNVYIEPHDTVKVSAGIAMETPKGTFGAIFARSGLSTKEGLRPANCVGVVDSSYRGEVFVALHNDTNEPRSVEVGERIAQLIVMEYPKVTLVETEELSDTERGSGGFGHSGK